MTKHTAPVEYNTYFKMKNSKTPILDLLQTLRISRKISQNHVGGSFGLFLLGYDLNDMSESV